MKKIKLGIISGDPEPKLLSVNRLSNNILKAARERFSPLFFSPEGYKDKQEMDKALEEFCEKVDIILELPRKSSPFSYSRKVPILIFAYGFFSQVNKHLPELWNFFWPRNSLLFSCEADLGIFNKVFDNSKEMAHLLPWPVDTRIFKPQAEEKRLSIRSKFGIKKNSPLLLYAGRLTHEKNIHTLLKIFSEVIKRFPGARLCIAGKIYDFSFDEYTLSLYRTDYSKIVSNLVKKYKLEDNVVFSRPLAGPELCALYSAADVFINCTLWPEENFGYAQVEAMACGTPVVCSAWGGLKDTVIDSVTGFFMDTVITDRGPRVDWRRGVEAIINIFEDRPLRNRLSKNCISHIKKNFSLTRFAAKLEEIMEKSLRRSKAIGDSRRNLFKEIRPELMDAYLSCLYKKITAGRHSASTNSQNSADNEKLHFDKFLLGPYSSIPIEKVLSRNGSSVPYFLTDVSFQPKKNTLSCFEPNNRRTYNLEAWQYKCVAMLNSRKSFKDIYVKLRNENMRIPKERVDSFFKSFIMEGIIFPGEPE